MIDFRFPLPSYMENVILSSQLKPIHLSRDYRRRLFFLSKSFRYANVNDVTWFSSFAKHFFQFIDK